MSYSELQKNWESLQQLLQAMPTNQNEQLTALTKRYIEQNISVLNDVFATSIEHMERLAKAKSPTDIICTQAHFSNELSRKLNLSAQRFLNASLGQIADYNEWLKAHCDFSTD